MSSLNPKSGDLGSSVLLHITWIVAGVSTSQTAAARGIGHVVAIPDVDDVGGHSAAGTHGSAVPGPAVVGYQAAAAGAESVILAIALNDGRGIVDVGFAVQRQCRTRQHKEEKQGGEPLLPEYGIS